MQKRLFNTLVLAREDEILITREVTSIIDKKEINNCLTYIF